MNILHLHSEFGPSAVSKEVQEEIFTTLLFIYPEMLDIIVYCLDHTDEVIIPRIRGIIGARLPGWNQADNAEALSMPLGDWSHAYRQWRHERVVERRGAT